VEKIRKQQNRRSLKEKRMRERKGDTGGEYKGAGEQTQLNLRSGGRIGKSFR
jgi:hypothetical protein